MKFENLPIQRKIMRVILITSGIILLLVSASYVTYEYFTFRQNTIDQLSTEGKIVALNSTAAIAFENQEDAIEVLSGLKAERNIVTACLYDKGGHLFAEYSPDSIKRENPATPMKDGFIYRGDFLEAFIPVTQNDTRLGTLFLRVNMVPIYNRFKLYALIILLSGGIIFLLAYYLSKRLQKHISGPVLELAETASIISEKQDYSVRAKKWTNDEIGLLTDAFNQMLSQIEIQNTQIENLNRELEEKVKKRTAELQQSNEDLQQQKEFIEAVLDSSVDITAVYDVETRIISFNKACERLYERKKEDVLGKKFLEAFPNSERTEFYKDILRALKGEFIHIDEYKSPITGKYFETFFVPLKAPDNQVYAVLTIAHEITYIIEASEKLKDINAALTKSNRDLEQFAYVASHDLQEPLRKIQIFIQLIEKKLKDPESGNYLAKVKNAAQRMTELIRSVLAYSRLTKNNEEFSLVDLNEIVDNVKNDFELVIAEKKAIIRSDKLPCIRGNHLQINQLFANLINNSLKFCLDKPLVEISCTTIRDHGKKTGEKEYIELRFKDNGIGFEEKHAEKMFTIFQRLHNRENFTGTGIGLAVCKKIVENHEGTITAFGELNKGATFIVRLPRETEINDKVSDSN